MSFLYSRSDIVDQIIPYINIRQISIPSVANVRRINKWGRMIISVTRIGLFFSFKTNIGNTAQIASGHNHTDRQDYRFFGHFIFRAALSRIRNCNNADKSWVRAFSVEFFWTFSTAVYRGITVLVMVVVGQV